MKIKCESEYIQDKYSKYADEAFLYKDQPVVSFPFEITDIPEDVKYFCFSLIDYDAIAVCGFPWIHWVVANVSADNTLIFEDFSRDLSLSKIQGSNSFASFFVGETDENITQKYVGPTPPDKDHEYVLSVYGLKAPLALKDGFFLNELHKEMKDKIICKARLTLKGKV